MDITKECAVTMLNITILGAGSAVFARQIITDILQIEGLDEGSFALVDIDVRPSRIGPPDRRTPYCHAVANLGPFVPPPSVVTFCKAVILSSI